MQFSNDFSFYLKQIELTHQQMQQIDQQTFFSGILTDHYQFSDTISCNGSVGTSAI